MLLLSAHASPDVLLAGAAGLLAAVLLALPTWLVSVMRRDASLADRVWSAFIVVPGVVYAWRLGADARMTVMLTIGLVWALRLGLYITIRNWGHGEDRRYADIRQRHEPGFALKSLGLIFLLQALLGWIVSWPLLAGSGAGRATWSVLDCAGAALAIAGVLIETTADAQLARFRRRPDRQGQVLDTGLWRYSRHPNYFGECCVWWGLGAMSLSAGGWSSSWSLLSPLLMTVLLLKVSGVSLLEQDIGERRPAYRDYIARTSAFIPWPPKRGRAS